MTAMPDINSLLSGPLGAWLDEQALVRKRAHELAVSRWWKAAMVLGPLLIFIWILSPGFDQFKMFVTLGAIGGAYAWGNMPRAKAIKDVKIGINQAIAGEIGLEYEHDPAPDRGFELARTYRLVPGFDRSRFEDMWKGAYDGHPFMLHEAHLEERRGSGKHRRWVTVFRGSIISIGFAREFGGITLVSRSGRYTKFLGLGGPKDSIEIDGRRLDYVDMVHPDFEDAFDVYSTDQVEARTIVHPAYVERLIAIERAFHGEDICSLFHAGELVIALNCGNMFESGSIDAREDHSRVTQTVDQFARLAELVSTMQQAER
jgi:hypothetical protein